MKVTQREIDLVQRGISFHNNRAFLEAERCYQTVLRDNPRNSDALNLMGVLAVEANRNDIAIEYFRKAAKLAPAVAMYQNNLGNALSVQSELEEALPYLLKAVKFDPAYLDALCNLGKVYRLLGDVETSRTWFTKALAVNPQFLRAQAGLAEIDSELGRFDMAIPAFERILAQDPANVEAACGLALAKKFEPDDPWIGQLGAILRQPGLRPDQLAPLHHAFAKVCNDVGHYDDAFQHFSVGKKFKNSQFDPERLEEGYRLSCNLFTPQFFADRAGWGSNDERPVFVVGLPRSGTTLTEQILASHPLVEGLGELPDMRKIAQKLDYGKGDPKEFARKIRRLSKSDVLKLAEDYTRVYSRATKVGALRFVDKSPHNYELLGLIALVFPKARVLHCKRNVMDNCVALYMQNFNDSHGYNRSLPDLGRYWCAYHQFMATTSQQLPLAIAEIEYEATVAHPEASARHIISAVGLSWDEACLRFYETERSVRTPSRWQVRQPVYSSSVGRWKRYEKHLAPLMHALAPALSGSHTSK